MSMIHSGPRISKMPILLDLKDQRIKELESTVLDLQSELSRKKMSLTVACNRVEELEDRLKLSIDTLKNVKRYLPMWGIDTVMDTLKDLGVE